MECHALLASLSFHNHKQKSDQITSSGVEENTLGTRLCVFSSSVIFSVQMRPLLCSVFHHIEFGIKCLCFSFFVMSYPVWHFYKLFFSDTRALANKELLVIYNDAQHSSHPMSPSPSLSPPPLSLSLVLSLCLPHLCISSTNNDSGLLIILYIY